MVVVLGLSLYFLRGICYGKRLEASVCLVRYPLVFFKYSLFLVSTNYI